MKIILEQLKFLTKLLLRTKRARNIKCNIDASLELLHTITKVSISIVQDTEYVKKIKLLLPSSL